MFLLLSVSLLLNEILKLALAHSAQGELLWSMCVRRWSSVRLFVRLSVRPTSTVSSNDLS